MKIFAQRFKQHLPLSLRFSTSILAASLVLIALIALTGLTAGAAPANGSPQASGSVSSTTPVARARVTAEVNGAELTALPGSKLPEARSQSDSGRLSSSTKLQGMSIYFSRSQSQEADLKALMAAQQTPGSPLYHQWLTPDQFAARFGMADSDIAKVQGWLEQQGFSVDSVNRSRNMIRFSGTSKQVEAAFATEMHTYAVKTTSGIENHFAPSTTLSVPSALAGVVEAVHNLDDFRPRSHLAKRMVNKPKPAFSGFDGSIFFAPGDIATQYDVQKEYNSGFTGQGQSIAVVGQSQIVLSDIEAFQTAAGLPVKDPNLVFVPGTGTAATSAGDETESDIDLEWAGAIAKGATISLVYTGNSQNSGAFDSLEYAIDNRLANIISSSYGSCETDLGGFSLESAFEQAVSQGQTILSAAGDDGSTDCFGNTDLSTTQQEALAVDYPGSSPNVTSVGGTEISQANAAYETQGSAYWSESNGTSDIITSLLQPVPEQVWNEDSTCLQFVNEGGSPLCGGGGGVSTLFPKPAWQTGVPGIPADGQRDVPDISLEAAIYNPGYVLCTSDQSAWDLTDGQQGSCTNGFRDSTGEFITAAGGTSFAAPIFAGMLAIINQQQGYTTGYGPVNAELYTLASNATTYASAFHDITTGDNKCDASGHCSSSGESDYAAGTGYDQATGLGTVDLTNLGAAWPASSGTGTSLIATTTTVTASNTAPNVNVNDAFTITVAPDTGSGVPTGTVTITVDSDTPITETLTANGTYVYTTSFVTAGAHTVLVKYAGDSTYAASTGSTSVNVTAVSSGTGTFTIAATNVAVAQGSAGTSTITVTPAGGYTGTIAFSLSTTSSALANACNDTIANALVTGTGTATTSVTIETSAVTCTTAAFRKGKFVHAAGFGSSGSAGGTVTGFAVFTGLLLAGFLGRYSRKLRMLAGVILLATIGMAFTGCGGSSSNTIANAPKGTYTMTLTGTDANSATIPAATTTFTLTIQ